MNILEEEDIKILSLNEICRACLLKSNNMKNLLQSNNEAVEIIHKLSSLANVEVEVDHTLPHHLCNNCEEALKIAYDFQQLCRKSEQFISAYISTLEPSETQQLQNNYLTTTSYVDKDTFEKKHTVTSIITDLLSTGEDNKNHEIPQGIFEKQFTTSESVEVKIEQLDVPEVPEIRTRSKQTMRLTQYPLEEVHKVMANLKKRYFKHVKCLCCGFTATNTRSLSVHMTRLHKKQKETWCNCCNENFENIQEHTQQNHKDEYKCTFCGKYCCNTGNLMEHLACHSVERKFECKQCKKTFISKRHLKCHNKVHTKEKLHSCRFCKVNFTKLKLLNAHYLKVHKKHRCKTCEEVFSTMDEYNRHKCFSKAESARKRTESKNLNDGEVSQKYCKVCDKAVRSLAHHLETDHCSVSNNEETQSKALCSYCGKQFKSKAKLVVHIRTHTGELPYKCSFCDRKMARRNQLVVHERTHTGEKPYVCKFCGKAFAQSSVLGTHLRLHTGKTDQCLVCHKKFCRPSELRAHMRLHTGEKPFECKVCGMEFTARSSLATHSKKHRDERLYKCSFCTKSFKRPYTLKIHMDIHLGQKPFACPHCPYACRQSYSLKQHMLQHEKKVDVQKCGVSGQCFTDNETLSVHFNSEQVPNVETSEVKEENLLEVTDVEIIGGFHEFT